MKYWQEQGTPVEKLNMGFATYGRAFLLSSGSSQVGAPASGPAAGGPFTKEAGYWSYYEVKLAVMHPMHLSLLILMRCIKILYLTHLFRSALSFKRAGSVSSGLRIRKFHMPPTEMYGLVLTTRTVLRLRYLSIPIKLYDLKVFCQWPAVHKYSYTCST